MIGAGDEPAQTSAEAMEIVLFSIGAHTFTTTGVE
jgi:hypothetical protein